MKPIQITYLNHSGFSVEIGKTMLVFDYFPADQAEPEDPGVLTGLDLAKYEDVLVFVSHAHPDHFDPRIYDWEKNAKCTYVLSYDIPGRYKGNRLHVGEKFDHKDVHVEAFDSTDEGVSFLVEIGGYTIFHAGDLNLWHWREESSLHDIELAEQAFYRAVKPLEKRQIDIAFFPVDPRQGALYDAGANYFVMAVKPRVLIPMHWQGRADVALDYARRTRNRRVQVIALVKRGESITLEKPEVEPVVEQSLWAHETLSRAILQEREEKMAKELLEDEEAEAEEDAEPSEAEEEESQDDEKPDATL